jgi:hypothetical protein
MASGCGGASRPYTPDTDSARQALDAVLGAWQRGQSPTQLSTALPTVYPVDSQWQSGQVLERYEILAEENGGDVVHRRFAVKLALKGPKGAKPAEKQTSYVVLGRGPLWVYRDEDYTRFLNMDNHPAPARRRHR